MVSREARSRNLVLKILIIDDDPAGTRLISTLLEFEGFEAIQLQNWTEPLSDVEKHRPDLVLMDIYLRTQNGFELLSELRSHPDYDIAHTPVLMMSAENHEAQSKRAGADGFLAKPFNVDSMVDAIRAVKEGRESTN